MQERYHLTLFCFSVFCFQLLFSVKHFSKHLAMASSSAVTLYNESAKAITNSQKSKVEWVQEAMHRKGVIVHVWTTKQAKIAEDAGAIAVSVTEPPSVGISRMANPSLVIAIKRTVSIPVFSRVRVGHFVEAQILEAVGVDCIDESEVIEVADERNFINKNKFQRPFICGARDLGEALRRIREGAAMIRIQGSDNFNETVKSVRCLMGELNVLMNMNEDEVFAFSEEIDAPYDMLAHIRNMGSFPLVHYAAGGIVTPADAAFMMNLGCRGVFLGSEVFGCQNPSESIRNIVQAVKNYEYPRIMLQTCFGLDEN